MVEEQEEYGLPSGETISIQLRSHDNTWEVACWDADDQNRWYKEFASKEAARTEFERWRPK